MSSLENSPGYIDIHCHGGGGFYFSDPNPDNIRRVIDFHTQNGTSRLLASLLTETIDNLKIQIANLVTFCESGLVDGIHLEGPYLAKTRCGAHNPELLKIPTINEVSQLLEISRGHIKVITLAPELPNAIDVIKYLASKGVVAAIGHSNGNYEDALRAVDAGASLVTHFSNGMSKLKDGDKTFATALLYETSIPLEIIFDRFHVNDDDVRIIVDSAPDRMVLITDAMSAAGQPDGNYRIGSRDVIVEGGVARLRENGALAGSTLTMKMAVENAKSFGISNELIENAAKVLPLQILRPGV